MLDQQWVVEQIDKIIETSEFPRFFCRYQLCITVFWPAFTYLINIPVTPRLCQHSQSGIVILLNFSHYTVWWDFTIVLICIFLMTNDLEHLFVDLLAFHVSHFVKYLFTSFAYIYLRYLFFIIRVLYKFCVASLIAQLV